MIFDLLAGMIEKWAPELVRPVDAATLIRLDGIPHHFLAKQLSKDELYRLDHQFCLPGATGVVAVEDKGSCVVLFDPAQGDRFGISIPRAFIDCIPSNPTADMAAYSDPPHRKALNEVITKTEIPGTAVVTVGTIQPGANDANGWQVSGQLSNVFLGTPEALQHEPGFFTNYDHPSYTAITLCAMKNAMTAMEEVFHIEAMPLFDGWPVMKTGPMVTLKCRIRRSNNRRVWNVTDTGRIEERSPCPPTWPN